MNNGIDYKVLSLFNEDDRREKEYFDEEEKEKKIQIIYKSSVKVIKKRLDIIGFNLVTLKYFFEKKKLENYDLLNNLTFESYLGKLKDIYENNIFFFGDNYFNENKNLLIESDEHMKYILEDMESTDSRSDIDHRYYLRGFLEKLDETIEISVDLSDLIEGGYYNENEKFAENNLKINDKVILFVEGSTDIEFIKKSMKLLFPEYVSYYTFLDIEGPKLELNADRIVTYCKSLISANILNKTIFMFDNDLTGHQAKNKLQMKKASNFQILAYPDIKFTENYPTICPTGIEYLNINGSACSLELYFSYESLKNNDDDFVPIQWKNYEEKEQKYQGSFSDSDKSEIQKKFRKILQQCESDKSKINNYNFDNMKFLLENIFIAFDQKLLN